METLADAVELYRPLADNQFVVTPEGAPVAKQNSKVIETWLAELTALDTNFIDEVQFDKLQATVEQKCQVSGKNLFQPLRVAVVGKPQGAELKKLAPLLPVKSLKWRAQTCLKGIGV
jgi:nondiscriminating glutamyl-tRNA synthetase